MRENHLCSVCCQVYPEEQLTEFGGAIYCQACLEEETVVCTYCGERIRNDDNAGSSNTPLCQDCYDDYYTTCTRCGCLLRQENASYEDDYAYCDDCHSQLFSDRVISDYYYKPAPIFYGDGSRFFGVELEVDDAGENDESAEAVLRLANRGKTHIYCKHDGSLGRRL